MTVPSARSMKKSSGRRHGMALYIVILVVALLTLAGYAFLSLMSTEFEATQVRGTELQVQHVTQSGVSWMESILTLSGLERDKRGGLYDNPRQFCAVPVFGEQHGERNTARFTIISPKIENSVITGVRYGLTNESGKLHLAKILEWETQMQGAGKKALLNLPGMTETMADSILDWVDADTTPRINGAELPEYQQLGLPYGPRNAVPVSLEELLMVRDVTRENLFGGDENFNFVPDDMESGKQNRTHQLAWTHLLTVHSAERDASPEGFARIDLNQPDLKFLHKLLEERVNKKVADFVILLRQFGPETTASEKPAPSAKQPQPVIDFETAATYRLMTPLDVVGVSVGIPDFETAIDSPIGTDQASLEGILLTFLDQATTSPTTTIIGRVNINESPREVLLGIPEMTSQMVQQIINRRNNQRATFRHPSWLLAEKIVDLPTLKMLWPEITCGGDVFRAQIIGFFDETGTFSRRETVVDATVFPPREISPKDLTSYGIGFSNPVLFGENIAATPQNSLQSIMDAIR